MVNCKEHRFDQSSDVGVCATCLRERLFATIAAQQRHAQPFPTPLTSAPKLGSADSAHSPRCRFFDSTTQLDLNLIDAQDEKNNKGRKFASLFKGLFPVKLGEIPSSATANTSDFPLRASSVNPRRKKGNFKARSVGNRARGLSPVRDFNEEEEDRPEFYEEWKQTPNRKTPPQQWRGEKFSGLRFCLSPIAIVRPTPNRSSTPKGIFPEMMVAGGLRFPAMEPSLRKNRSRKLADQRRCNRFFTSPHL